VATLCGEKTQTAFSLMMSLRGTPAITWGTEVGFVGKTEPEVRSDMRFEAHPMHEFLSGLLDDRRAYSPLTDGLTDILSAKEDGLVIARVMPSEAVIIRVGEGEKPALPKVADAGHWIPIESVGIKRWLVTPKTGNGFQSWVDQIQDDQSNTSTVTIKMGNADYLSGSDPAVGAWDPKAAVGPGEIEVALPQGGVVAVKKLKRTEEGQPVWSSHPDHFIDVDEAIILGEPVKMGR